MPPEYFRWLAVDPPPEGGDYFIQYDDFLREQEKLSNDQLEAYNERKSQAAHQAGKMEGRLFGQHFLLSVFGPNVSLDTRARQLVGDPIRLVGHPMKDGSKGISLFYAIRPDGTRLYHDIARPKDDVKKTSGVLQ